MSFLVLSDVITEREYTSDIPESNKQKGIRCFKFFELATARKKSVESNFRIAYVCETVELAKSLERPTRGLTILAENTGAVSSHSISSFIIKPDRMGIRMFLRTKTIFIYFSSFSFRVISS